MAECFARILTACGGEARLTWVSEAFLLERGVEPWLEMPLWVPAAESGFAKVSAARAIAAGLTFRPLEQTAADTLAWDRGRPAEARTDSPVLTAGREAGVLAAWHARSGK